MKLSRDELKNIVKECLVEILSEGLTGATQTINENRRPNSIQQPQQKTPSVNPRQTVADKIAFLPKNSPPKQQVDRNMIKAATSDPLLQEMLADTAIRGTPIVEESRVAQARNEIAVSAHGDIAAKTMMKSDPTDIFSDSASKWATLAFSEKKLGA